MAGRKAPSFLAALSRNAGNILLYSVLTSVSLNCSGLMGEREEKRRLHHLQCAMLAQLHATLERMPSSSRVTLGEQRLLARRLRALHVDPLRVGIPPSLVPGEHEGSGGKTELTWGTALFGVGVTSRVRESAAKAVKRVLGREDDGRQYDVAMSDEEASEEEEEWMRALDEAVRRDSEEEAKKKKKKTGWFGRKQEDASTGEQQQQASMEEEKQAIERRAHSWMEWATSSFSSSDEEKREKLEDEKRPVTTLADVKSGRLLV